MEMVHSTMTTSGRGVLSTLFCGSILLIIVVGAKVLKPNMLLPFFI